MAMCYGVDDGIVERAASWRKAGYRIGIMTGVAWGGYQDWYEGRYDGVCHREDIQKNKKGEEVGHGGTVYYMAPSMGYNKYLAERVEFAVGKVQPEYLIMEEPEFWSHSGYSDTFKKEWEAKYGEPWRAPDSDPVTRWKAAKLMYELYWRALDVTMSAGKKAAAANGKSIKCVVATHSLVNYTCWRIVSPEASMMSLPACDGIIAQAWTGTARSPIKYEGVVAERSFENGILEYGIVANMDRIPGKEVWLLHDPVEDNPDRDWNDYRDNWERTVAASLLCPEINRYEVLPWPDRIYNHPYKAGPKTDEKIMIPDAYRKELARIFQAFREMPDDSPGCFKWRSPDPGIGVIFSDTAMFMRGEPAGSTPHLDEFYGQALPLIKHGIMVRPVQAEFVAGDGFLDQYKVIMLSYDFQLPPSREFQDALVRWVNNGGGLIYVGRDYHPYFSVPEWWNDGGKTAQTPVQALMKALGVGDEEVGAMKVGKGWAHVIRKPAADWAESRAGSQECLRTVRAMTAMAAPEVEWREANYMLLERGPFITGQVFSETESDAPLAIPGRWINLFSDSEDVLTDPVFKPGSPILMKKVAP